MEFKWAKKSYCGLPSENVAVETEPVFREIQASLQQDILLECTGVICVQRARANYSPTDCSTVDPNLLTKMSLNDFTFKKSMKSDLYWLASRPLFWEQPKARVDGISVWGQHSIYQLLCIVSGFQRRGVRQDQEYMGEILISQTPKHLNNRKHKYFLVQEIIRSTPT